MSKAKAHSTTLRKQTRKAPRKERAISQYDRYRLPFFDKKAKPAPSTWSVKPSGDYFADCQTGRDYALQFLLSADGSEGWGSLLAQITGDMIRAGTTGKYANGERKINGIVIGFMSAIGRAINNTETGQRAVIAEAVRQF
jgi:hypothetical protein